MENKITQVIPASDWIHVWGTVGSQDKMEWAIVVAFGLTVNGDLLPMTIYEGNISAMHPEPDIYSDLLNLHELDNREIADIKDWQELLRYRDSRLNH